MGVYECMKKARLAEKMEILRVDSVREKPRLVCISLSL